MSWHNSDGLLVRFGREEGTTQVAGEYRGVGQLHEVMVLVDYSKLDDVAVGTEQILSDTVRIPDGAFLKSAVFYVETAFDSAGEAATLSFGLIETDRSTAVDADGIDVTIAEAAIDAIGDEITCDGALIETVLNPTDGEHCLITATVGTEAFTAGKGYLTISWYEPHTYTP